MLGHATPGRRSVAPGGTGSGRPEPGARARGWSRCCARSRDSVSPLARLRRLTLGRARAHSLLESTDASRIRRVVRNLLDNASSSPNEEPWCCACGAQRASASARRTRGRTPASRDEPRRPASLAPFEQADGSTRRRWRRRAQARHRASPAKHIAGALEIVRNSAKGTVIRVQLPLTGLEGLRELATPDAAGQGTRWTGPDRRQRTSARSACARCWTIRLASREAAGSSEAQRHMASQAFDLAWSTIRCPMATAPMPRSRCASSARPGGSIAPCSSTLLTANLFAHEQLGALAAIDGVLSKPLFAGRTAQLARRSGVRIPYPRRPIAPVSYPCSR